MRTAFVALLAAAYMAASGNAVQLAEPFEFAQINCEDQEEIDRVRANLKKVSDSDKHYVDNVIAGPELELLALRADSEKLAKIRAIACSK